ncbi:MAG TPA: RDD family protein [Terriglobales bacterium]|nr:RDD family protein [Terriglobales bacterium]
MATNTTVYCSECGQAFSPSEVVNLAGATVCGPCKPALLRRLQEGAVQLAPTHYKGFWLRFLAKILDNLIIEIVCSPLLLFAYMPFWRWAIQHPQPDANQAAAALVNLGTSFALAYLGVIIVLLAYNTLMLGKWGTTMGKMAIGAKVVSPTGEKISYATALGRTAMELVNLMTLDIGYIIAAFDEKKRGLHDRVAGTVVVAK